MKTCYAFDMPGNEFLPDEIEAGVKNVSLIFFSFARNIYRFW